MKYKTGVISDSLISMALNKTGSLCPDASHSYDKKKKKLCADMDNVRGIW